MDYRIVLAAFSFLPLAAQAAQSPADKYHTDSPIEINADALEVFQEENRAVFSGHVVAIQGDVRLKSDTMTVHYRNPDADKEKSSDAKASGGERDAVRRIDANGHVFLSTPEETASGDEGIYDVEQHQIRLNNQVVLTRGQNVLKGDKLTYNFETGKSVITGGAVVQAKEDTGGKPQERVRALFVPDKNDKLTNGKK